MLVCRELQTYKKYRIETVIQQACCSTAASLRDPAVDTSTFIGDSLIHYQNRRCGRSTHTRKDSNRESPHWTSTRCGRQRERR